MAQPGGVQKGRIAGDAPGYTFRLCRVQGDGALVVPTRYGFEMPSVSTFIGEVMGKPAGAMSWWGFRIGLKGVAELLERDVTALIDAGSDPEALEAVLKDAGINPNMKLKEAGDRGDAAHTVLEKLAVGDNAAAASLAAQETLEHDTGYGWAVIEWWAEQIAPHLESGAIVEVLSEVPVWSIKHWYAGTFDLGILWSPEGEHESIRDGWEILDLKTHRPASGFTKPGSGPAYISDVTQIRAYRMAFEELGGVTIGQRVIVARDKAYRGVRYLQDDREVPARFVELIREAYEYKTTFEKEK
jgi:hypothetical protein